MNEIERKVEQLEMMGYETVIRYDGVQHIRVGYITDYKYFYIAVSFQDLFSPNSIERIVSKINEMIRQEINKFDK